MSQKLFSSVALAFPIKQEVKIVGNGGGGGGSVGGG